MTKTATYVKTMEGRPEHIHQILYRCDPPMEYDHYNQDTGEYERRYAEHVIVSAIFALFSGDETYIFPADSGGEITSWGELVGSFRGAQDHDRALERAGYEVVGDKR